MVTSDRKLLFRFADTENAKIKKLEMMYCLSKLKVLPVKRHFFHLKIPLFSIDLQHVHWAVSQKVF